MFKKISLYILNKCWQFIATALILLAVLITVARYMMPSINNYRESIEQLITEKSGITISIGHIEGSWDSLGAFIKITDVRFGAKTDTVTKNNTSIAAVKISIATFPSLFYRTLITEQLTIEGLSLKIRQQQSSEFILPDIIKHTSNSPQNSPVFASTIQDWLQNQAKITLYKTHLDISLRNGHQYPVDLDEITFKKGKNIYQLTGLSKLPGDNQIDITFEVNGFLTDASTVGQLYIDTHQINMQELPVNALLEEADISSGTLDLKIWADWKNKHFESALISLDIDDFQMSLMNEPQTDLNKLKSYLVWQRQQDGWIFDSQKTEIISDDRNWPDPSLQIEMLKKDDQKHYSISASRLDIGIWADFILTNPNLETAIKKQLLGMNINGLIDDSRIYASFDDQIMTEFRANARFSELRWQPWKKIPGISNLAGQFEIHDDKGMILLDSRNAKLDYPALFRWPFDIKSINSRFSWNIYDQSVSLNLHNLTTEITEAQLQADGNFNILLDTDSVELNLYAELNKANVAKTKNFLPTGIMTNKLVNYLDNSIKSGSLDSAQIVIRGPAKQFPYANAEGVFSINAQISDTRYKFTEGWPEINKLTADLWFVGNSMDIEVTGGESVGQNISSASIDIDNFKANPPLLLVKSSSLGSVENGIDYLNQSPLADSIGKIFEIIPATGPFILDLDLTIPLGEIPAIRVDGKVHLTGNSLVVQPIAMKIDNIKGDLIITNSLLSANNLTAEFMGGKSNLTLQQTIDENKLLSTKIMSEGDISSDGIRTVFPDWVPLKISGQTNYHSQLLLPEVVTKNDIVMDLTVESELLGISSPFPEPFNKLPTQKENLLLHYKILQNNQQLLDTSVSEIVDLKMHFSDQSATSGRIVFGGEKAAISGMEGIELTGQIEHFNLAPWLDLLSEQLDTKKQMSLSDGYRHLYINNLHISKLDYHFMDFDDVTVAANVKDHAFNFTLSGDDISGLIKVPDTILQLPIDINLSSLIIEDQFPAVADTTSSENLRKSFANPLPPLDIHCQQCIYNDKQTGITTINIRPLDNGNSFNMMIEGEGILGLNVQGEWISDAGSEVVTKLSGKMTTDKLGDLLTLFNRKTGIHDTNFETVGDLSWQGDPLQFNYQTLNGQLAIKGGKGNQEDVSDSGARLFSLLSIGSLARKLTLDFSDLFGKGFFYTGMEGNFAVNSGIFSTENFKIDGTSADVEIVGQSDFPNNRIQNCILVTPDLSASLPVLAGWAIEPVTGLVVYLMSKIFQPVLKVVTSIQYKIEGSFDSPVITEIGKSEGVVKVDNSEHIGGKTAIITEGTDQQKFSCDNIFKNKN